MALLFPLIFFGCSKFDEAQQQCVEEYLEKYDMIPYRGQEIGCHQMYSILYEYHGEFYFMMICDCCDMIVTLEDCEGNQHCYFENDTEPVCDEYWDNSNCYGIIGLEE